MLNISDHSITASLNQERFKAFRLLKKSQFKRLPMYMLFSLVVTIFACLFLPWTQNIAAKGYVTTRLPEQRPQGIQSVIGGRLEKWHVREGDFVEAGDTLIFLSEIKSEYFDPELIERTSEQVEAKAQSVETYENKVKALADQYQALQAALQLKREQIENKILQARNKISIDSIDLQAFRMNYQIAENQQERIRELYDKGLKTLSELQEKELKLQEMFAKITSQENKLLNRRNELANSIIERSAVDREYQDKLAKSLSDQQSARSSQLESMAATAKLKNQLSNYSQRQRFYHILAPQSGYITKTLTKGIGEIVKEGSDIATIMPAKYDLAIELYIPPQDLPLIQIGSPAVLRFDGWPAIVISGWPEGSTGIFYGEVVAIDQFISDNGFYRILISPDPDVVKTWPPELRVGTGAQAFLLIKDVPIWYETWRQLNGFPPDFYRVEDKADSEVKLKAPLKSVK